MSLSIHSYKIILFLGLSIDIFLHIKPYLLNFCRDLLRGLYSTNVQEWNVVLILVSKQDE